VDRPQTIIATRSRAVALAALATLLGAGGCYQSFAVVDDDGHDTDARIEADGAVDAHGEAAADAEVETDPGVDAGADSDAATCVGGVYDPTTGLCWQDWTDGGGGYWDDAVAYCAALSLGGYDDWRLPTISELRSLIRGCPATETGGSCGVVDTCLSFDCWSARCEGCPVRDASTGVYASPELGGCGGDRCWSSSHPYPDGRGDSAYAWYVQFGNGRVWFGEVTSMFVRCVRPGP
jgi:hypothetical protein